MNKKECSICKEIKCLSMYYKHHRNKDGKTYACKVCILKQRKVQYKSNKVKIDKYRDSYRLKEKINGFALYYLPEEHYVGFTNNIKSRLRTHKAKGRFTKNYEIIGVYSCPIYTHLLETRLHLMGYNGFQYKY